MRCPDFRELADSYLGDELLVETNHDVLAHLERCPDCRRELAARRELRLTLRRAFKNSPEFQINSDLAVRVRSHLRQTVRPSLQDIFSSKRAWLAVAASLLIVLGIVTLQMFSKVQSEPDRVVINTDQKNKNEQLPLKDDEAEVRIAFEQMADSAVGDHLNCAVRFNLPVDPIDLEEAGRQYDHAYLNLERTVRANLLKGPDALKFVESHSCLYKGRRFAHLVFEQHHHLISFLVTDLDRPSPGKNFERGPEITQCSPVGNYQVSCFVTARHAVFVVSNMNRSDNLSAARALASTVHEHLMQAESST